MEKNLSLNMKSEKNITVIVTTENNVLLVENLISSM